MSTWPDYKTDPVAWDAEYRRRLAALPAPTKHDRERSAMCWSYGEARLGSDEDFANGVTHTPSRAVFEKIGAEHYGWTKDVFDAWAAGKEWS